MKANFQFKNYILSTVFIVLCVESYSKNVDSLIFSNDYEKKIFTKYCKGEKIDPLDILISIDYTSKSELINVKLTNFYESLEKNGFKELSRKKQIKEIYKKVHSTFLRKYTEEVQFSEIFENGNYNCVIASSLYGIVLEHYGIDFQVKKTEVHVYIVADPKGEQIAIESTQPNKGLVVYDDRMKKSFVDYLKENKLISDNEYRTQSINELFDKNYTKATSINLIELIALQYSNNGIVQSRLEKFDEAVKCFEKAELLYPDNSIKFMKSSCLVNLLIEQNKTKQFNGITLAKYINSNKKSSASIEFTNGFFNDVSRELVINHPNIAKYHSYYNSFFNNLSDSIEKKEFNQTYNDLLGYYYYTNQNYEKALFHYDKSYENNPDNIQTKQVLLELIFKSIGNENYSLDKVDTLLNQIIKYRFILDNTSKHQMIAFVFLANFIEANENGNITKQEKSLKRINDIIISNKLNDSYPDLVSSIYSQLASFYFRNRYYENQEEIIRKGLELVPNSEKLASDLRIFLNSKQEYMRWAKANNVPTKIKPYSIDKETESVLKIIANRNRVTINANIDKFLKNSKLTHEAVVISNKIVNLDNKERHSVQFNEGGLAKIIDPNYTSDGTWTYDKNSSTLRFFDSKDGETTNIVIYEFDGEVLKAITFNDGKAAKIISIFKRY